MQIVDIYFGFQFHVCYITWLQYSNTQESVSTQRTAKAVAAAESRTDGWLLLDEGELQQRRNLFERNATWHHVMQLPCPSPSAPVTHLINTTPNASAASSSMTTTTTTVTTTRRRKMDPNLIIKTHDLSFFISPQRENSAIYFSGSSSTSEEDNCVESQTLQLFPLRSGDGISDNMKDNETEISASAMNANNLTPGQFFEFLPMKE